MRNDDTAGQRQDEQQDDQRYALQQLQPKRNVIGDHEARHDSKRDQHLEKVDVHLFQDQHVLRYVDLRDDPFERIDDPYADRHVFIKEIPDGQTDDHDHRKIFSAGAENDDRDEHIDEHEEHRG